MANPVSGTLAVCAAATVASDEPGWTETVSRGAGPAIRVGSAVVGLIVLELTNAELTLESLILDSLDCGAANCMAVGGVATGT
jgi:hypothetical protein